MGAQLNVIGYQFPGLTDAEMDSDWLLIHLQLQWGEHRWERTDPAITTFELAGLAAWLLEVAQHAAVFGGWKHNRLSTRCFFTEPNLSVEAFGGHPTGQPVTLRLYLGAEFLPPFKALLPTYPFDDSSEVWLDFGVDEAQLRALANQIQQQLQRFPVRVGLRRHPLR